MSRVASLFLMMLVASLAVGGRSAAAQAPAADPSLPELIRTKQRVFAIPFRLPQPRDADAAPQRVVLSVSTDLGMSWRPAGEVTPAAGSFTYRTETDGEYWFRIRVVDAKGRARGGAGPDIRVLVDAAGPRIAARVWKGDDGEIICRYAATDDSLRMESLRVEYRGAADSGWKPLAAEGILSRETPAHMVGEDIWWAGEKVDTLAVRITITDTSGNQTVRQFPLEQTDPRVDQATLARELGVPPLPTRESTVDAGVEAFGGSALSAAAAPLPPRPSATGVGWPPEQGSDWQAERRGPGESPVATGSEGSVNRFVSRDPLAAPAATTESLAAAAAAESAAMHYRGRPLQVSRSRRFAWEYDVQEDTVAGRPLRIELWCTRDSGVTWQRAGTDTDGRSPIDVSLPAAGLYGFRLVIVPDGPAAEAGPRSGEAPETWVAIDDEPPVVEIVSVTTDTAGESAGILIRYACRDQLPAPRGVRLSFSPHADGPWSTIADRLEAEGTHRWQPDPTTPPVVSIRVEATDVAGNVGHAVTTDRVTLPTGRVVGRLRGLRELPATPAR